MSKLGMKVAAVLSIVGACGLAASDANACGGGWFPEEAIQEIDYRPSGIAMAEQQLEDGDYDAAAATVMRVIPHIHNYDKIVKDQTINKAMRVLALATARNDGELEPQSMISWYIRDVYEQRVADNPNANSEWAVNAMRALAGAGEADDPVLQSELGEVLAASTATQAEGRELLEKLAEKDLLTSPEAYKALAELRDSADGRTAALERCRAMAKSPEACTIAS